jgi:hypothetical protein
MPTLHVRENRAPAENTSPPFLPAQAFTSTTTPSQFSFTRGERDAESKDRISRAYGKLAMNFEENQGQFDPEVKFVSRGQGYSLFLTSSEAVFVVGKTEPLTSITTLDKRERAVLRMRLIGANPRSESIGVDEQQGKSNYFIGNDPAKWRTNVGHYARVQRREAYPGVDLIYHGNQQQLEYDFVISPGTKPEVITLAFDGAIGIESDPDGGLQLREPCGEIHQHKPIIYQEVNGQRKEVTGRYVLRGPQEIGFEIDKYDTSKTLVIDPVLSYSSYLGGSRVDEGYGIAVDSFGNAYVAGLTESADFPTVNSRPPRSSQEAFSSIGLTAASLIQTGYATANHDKPNSVLSMVQVDVGVTGSVLTCAKQAVGLQRIRSGVNAVLGAPQLITSCLGPVGSVFKHIISVFARDPNDKAGAQGVGMPRYLSGEEPVRYVVFFENEIDANAPAQKVVVTDQLDATKLDLDTFNFGPISFGKEKFLTPPAGLSEFIKDVDLRPANNLIVRINAKLDKTTGLLTWRFTSLDPVTGLPTEDPNAGFLPPNVNAPEGEGQVLFTVQPKQGITTGTEIGNRARIFFDNNPLIDTSEWLNTIDNTKPTSHIQPLPATQCATGISLQWSGTDAGAGIEDYTIFVSDNGGAFVPLRSNTTATSIVFQGAIGHTYSFYSVARDKTENFEDPPGSPDASVRVIAVAPATITPPPNIVVATASDATACGTVISDAMLGTAVAHGNCLGVSISRIGVPANHFFPVGDTLVTYIATDGAGNTSSASQRVTVTDKTPPRLSDIIADKIALSPPNHKLIDVYLAYDAANNCAITTCQVSVESNEPVNGTGDGDTAPDWEVIDSHHVRLRAERSGKGKGRIYSVRISCADRSNNMTSKTVSVFVPH